MKKLQRICLGLAMALSPACADKRGAPDDAAAAKAPAKTDTAKAEAKGEAAAPAKDEPVGPALPPAEELLAKAVDAVGGQQKLDQVNSFYQEARMNLSGQNIRGDERLWWQDGDFYAESTMVGIGTVRAGKQGDTIWAQDPISGLRKLEGREAEQAAWGSSLSLAADWREYFESARTVAERDLKGKKVYDVKLSSKSGDEVTITLDADTGLQVAQSFKQSGPLGDTPITVEFEDFREVDGFKVPFRQVTDASLAKVTQELVSLKINPQVDASKFAMPTGGADVLQVPLGLPGQGAAPSGDARRGPPTPGGG